MSRSWRGRATRGGCARPSRSGGGTPNAGEGPGSGRSFAIRVLLYIADEHNPLRRRSNSETANAQGPWAGFRTTPHELDPRSAEARAHDPAKRRWDSPSRALPGVLAGRRLAASERLQEVPSHLRCAGRGRLDLHRREPAAQPTRRMPMRFRRRRRAELEESEDPGLRRRPGKPPSGGKSLAQGDWLWPRSARTNASMRARLVPSSSRRRMITATPGRFTSNSSVRL